MRSKRRSANNVSRQEPILASLRRNGCVGEHVLVTGAAGFIGMHVAGRLLTQGYHVVGLDNLNAYYDPALKTARIAQLKKLPNFRFEQMDISERKPIAQLFAAERFSHVVHLAAQAGVRHSLVDPHVYVDGNLVGFLNVLEGCRQTSSRHLLYASSSSVYGANTRMPFRTSDNVDHPLNLYGVTKKANELMAHAYAHLFANSGHGLALFYSVRSLGTPGYGHVAVRRCHHAGPTSSALQPGPHEAGLHLHR